MKWVFSPNAGKPILPISLDLHGGQSGAHAASGFMPHCP